MQFDGRLLGDVNISDAKYEFVGRKAKEKEEAEKIHRKERHHYLCAPNIVVAVVKPNTQPFVYRLENCIRIQS